MVLTQYVSTCLFWWAPHIGKKSQSPVSSQPHDALLVAPPSPAALSVPAPTLQYCPAHLASAVPRLTCGRAPHCRTVLAPWRRPPQRPSDQCRDGRSRSRSTNPLVCITSTRFRRRTPSSRSAQLEARVTALVRGWTRLEALLTWCGRPHHTTGSGSSHQRASIHDFTPSRRWQTSTSEPSHGMHQHLLIIAPHLSNLVVSHLSNLVVSQDVGYTCQPKLRGVPRSTVCHRDISRCCSSATGIEGACLSSTLGYRDGGTLRWRRWAATAPERKREPRSTTRKSLTSDATTF
jgi:hypothetical protein